MGKKLYVGNIPFQATEADLTELFSKIAEVESVRVIINLQTRQSRGFAFIEMVSEEDAKKAIADLNSTTFMEKTIVVNEARPQKPREKRDFGGGRGGYDRGRGGFGRGKGPGGGSRRGGRK